MATIPNSFVPVVEIIADTAEEKSLVFDLERKGELIVTMVWYDRRHNGQLHVKGRWRGHEQGELFEDDRLRSALT